MLDLLAQGNEILPGIGIGAGGSGVVTLAIYSWLIRDKVKKFENHMDNKDIHFDQNLCNEIHKHINENLIEIKDDVKSLMEKVK
jgi:hypothetical protein